MYHKDAVLHSRKLDWMLLHRRDELRKIMRDNGNTLQTHIMSSLINMFAIRFLYCFSTNWIWEWHCYGLCGEPSQCRKDTPVT